MTDPIPDNRPLLGPSVPKRGNVLSRSAGRFVLWLMRWRVVGNPPDTPRFVMTAAPHTSNWDGLIFMIASVAMGLELHWIGKHTLFKSWRGGFMRWMGGISVNRKAAKDVVGQIADEFKRRAQLVVVVAPEGSRSMTNAWKSGFYRMAQQADVPIALGFMDYASKRVGFGPALTVTGDFKADMAKMMTFYQHVSPRFPEQYALHAG